MHSMTIILKNGKTIDFECESYTTATSQITGKITKFSFKEITGNCPVYVDFEEIAAIIEKKVIKNEQ